MVHFKRVHAALSAGASKARTVAPIHGIIVRPHQRYEVSAGTPRNTSTRKNQTLGCRRTAKHLQQEKYKTRKATNSGKNKPHKADGTTEIHKNDTRTMHGNHIPVPSTIVHTSDNVLVLLYYYSRLLILLYYCSRLLLQLYYYMYQVYYYSYKHYCHYYCYYYVPLATIPGTWYTIPGILLQLLLTTILLLYYYCCYLKGYLDEVVGESDSRGGVEYRAAGVGQEVGGHDRVLGVAQHSRHRPL